MKMVGVGSSVPTTVLTNDDLSRLVDTNDEWIVSRTGIRRRHVLRPDESIAGHAIEASKKALDMAGASADVAARRDRFDPTRRPRGAARAG